MDVAWARLLHAMFGYQASRAGMGFGPAYASLGVLLIARRIIATHGGSSEGRPAAGKRAIRLCANPTGETVWRSARPGQPLAGEAKLSVSGALYSGSTKRLAIPSRAVSNHSYARVGQRAVPRPSSKTEASLRTAEVQTDGRVSGSLAVLVFLCWRNTVLVSHATRILEPIMFLLHAAT